MSKDFIDPLVFLERVKEHYEGTRGDKYCESALEVSEVIEAFDCADGFTKGNAIKYLLRMINKIKRGEVPPDTDYFKLVHYIAMVWNLEREKREKALKDERLPIHASDYPDQENPGVVL